MSRSLPHNMTRARVALVIAGLAVLVGGHLYDAARQQEHWPFSSYPMFRNINTRQPYSRWVLYGVAPDGSEFGIHGDHAGVMNFRVHEAVRRTYDGRGDAARQERGRRLLAAFGPYYERRREAGEHDGPPLAGLRFYQLTWDFDPWARNRDEPRREVVLEVMSDGATMRPASAAGEVGR